MTIRHWRVCIVLVVIGAAAVLVGCGGGGTARAPSRVRIELTSPITRGTVTDGEVLITGVVSESSATVTVNGQEVAVGSDGAFEYVAPLVYGRNRIPIRAEADGFSDGTRAVTITRELALDVETPADGLEATENRITVTGTVSDPTATVRVVGFIVPVAADGSFSRDLSLHYPDTVITVYAEVPDHDPVSRSVRVTYTGVL